jgi:hypothetical protein
MQEEAQTSRHWHLGYSSVVVTPNNNGDDTDDSSVASKGSTITIVSNSTPASSLLPSVTSACVDPALLETPPEKRKTKRQSPDDCHILIRWSQLSSLVKNNFLCKCGKQIEHFNKRTIVIATELDFRCPSCNNHAAVLADRSNYMDDQSNITFIRRERRIDNYELNWRLIMTTQLIGESQMAGSILGMFLDLT